MHIYFKKLSTSPSKNQAVLIVMVIRGISQIFVYLIMLEESDE